MIRQLGLLKSNPEVIEEGVPVPTTIVLDRQGIVRFIDVRRSQIRNLDRRDEMKQEVPDRLP